MPDPMYCRRCGSKLPADAPPGVCPRCMLGIGLEEALEDVAAETQPLGPQAAAAEPRAARPRQARAGGADRPEPPGPEALADRFPQLEVLELLGRGGMGVVYKARHRGLDRLVALKILPPEAGDAPGFAERFVREARALARLNHPNIVAVHDFGQSGGQYYLLMEYVDGTNLRSLMGAGRLPPAEALAIVPQLCDALQYAHDEGVVHRDIKPENILLDKKGRVKVADFGLAKLVGSAGGAQTDAQLTATYHIMGTPRYMAPEQMEGSKAVDHRADIYSLGVVLYEMLTGEVPMGRFRAPSEKAAVDVRLDEVVMRSLEREPVRRYQHASEVKTAVAAVSAPPPLPPSVPAPATPRPPAERVAAAGDAPGGGSAAPAPTRRRWWRWAAAGLVVPLVLAGALAPYFGTGSAKRPPPEPSRLFKAVEDGDNHEAWRLTASHESSPNERGPGGVTPLMVAAAKGHTEIVQTLLETGASPGLQDVNGETALMMACANGHDDTVKALLGRSPYDQPAGVNARSNRGDTPLGLAAARGSNTTVEALLEKGAEVDAPANADGQTPLMIAAAAGHGALVNTLLGRGADVKARDNNNLSALVLAESAGKEGVAKLLRDRGHAEDERYWFVRGYSLALDGRHADAIPDLERVRKSFTGPSVPWSVPVRGWTYTIPTPRGTLLAALGECYEKVGQKDAARAAFLEAKAALPPHTSGVVLYRRRQRTAGGQTTLEYSVQPDELKAHADRLDRPVSLGLFQEEVTGDQQSGSRKTLSGFESGIIH